MNVCYHILIVSMSFGIPYKCIYMIVDTKYLTANKL